MRNTKYVMSGGLAFSEDQDMKKLRELSLKGWHVRDFKFMGYTLEKGISTDYIYSVDYRTLREDEYDEYFEFFSSSGWMHITSEGNIHLFRAAPGTKPIYSDRETVVEKHDNLGSSMKWGTISAFLLTVLLWVGTFMSTGTLQLVLSIMAILISILSIPMAWTVITIYHNKWKAEGKKGLAIFSKSLPILLVFTAIFMILFSVDKSSRTFLLLASMIVGAVTLPTAVWVIMSVYRKLRNA